MSLILFVEYVGIASAALSGFLFAVKKECDWLGVFLSAFLTALGGGIMRDMLVGRAVYSFTHYMPVSVVIFMLVVSRVANLHIKREGLERKFVFIFADAIDVICFSIVAAMVAIEYNYNIFGVMMIAWWRYLKRYFAKRNSMVFTHWTLRHDKPWCGACLLCAISSRPNQYIFYYALACCWHYS